MRSALWFDCLAIIWQAFNLIHGLFTVNDPKLEAQVLGRVVGHDVVQLRVAFYQGIRFLLVLFVAAGE